MFSAFNPSKYTHTWSSAHTHTHTQTHTWSSGHTHTPGAVHTHTHTYTHTHTHLEQWEEEYLGVRCLAQGSHLSRGQFLPELRFEPTTSGYKSDAVSVRPRLPPEEREERIHIMSSFRAAQSRRHVHLCTRGSLCRSPVKS